MALYPGSGEFIFCFEDAAGGYSFVLLSSEEVVPAW